jgi:hypothetical protein
MAISRPFLLALLGVVLLGATVLAVQNARDASDSDATPAAVQSDAAPVPAQTPADSAPAETLRSAFNLNALHSAKFAARLSMGNRSQSVRFDLSGAFERGAANEVPEFEVGGSIWIAKQKIEGGFVSLGDKAYFTQRDTGWRVPAAIWDPVAQAVAGGGKTEQTPGLQLHPETWVRDVKSEGTENVSGVETEHVSAAVDPAAVINDIGQALQGTGAKVVNRRQATRAVKQADFDVWVGTEDHIVRRLTGAVVISRVGRLGVDVRLSDVNEPQQIKAPAHIRAGAPGGLFGVFAEGLVGGATGGSVSLKAMTSPNPRKAARAVRDHKKVVIVFGNGRALDDRAMIPVIRSVDRRTKAVVLTDDVAAVERYGKLVEDLGVSQTPSIVIIDRSGHARLIEGYVDSDTLTQAVADAR